MLHSSEDSLSFSYDAELKMRISHFFCEINSEIKFDLKTQKLHKIKFDFKTQKLHLLFLD
jgi:hypothetical protein